MSEIRAYRISDLNEEILSKLFNLQKTMFLDSDWDVFTQDLRDKTEILAVFDDDKPMGFTTYLVYPYTWKGKDI